MYVTCITFRAGYWLSWDIHRFSKFNASLRNIYSDTVFSIAVVQLHTFLLEKLMVQDNNSLDNKSTRKLPSFTVSLWTKYCVHITTQSIRTDPETTNSLSLNIWQGKNHICKTMRYGQTDYQIKGSLKDCICFRIIMMSDQLCVWSDIMEDQ